MLVSSHCLWVITTVTHIQPAWHLLSGVGQPRPRQHWEHHGIANLGVRGNHMDSDNHREMHLIGSQRLTKIKSNERKTTTKNQRGPNWKPQILWKQWIWRQRDVFNFIVSKKFNRIFCHKIKPQILVFVGKWKYRGIHRGRFRGA